MAPRAIFSSESVGAGHPDKLADQISDSVLDACLKSDPYSRVACESCITTNFALVFGEITTEAQLDIPEIVRGVAQEVGYNSEQSGLDWRKMEVMSKLDQQSPDIKRGVDKDGAGDQGMMFGFACSESKELMPAPLMYAHALMMRGFEIQQEAENAWMGPDAKCQIGMEYERYQPLRVHTVVFSQQHSADTSLDWVRDFITNQIIKPTLAESGYLDEHTQYIINPAGPFTTGGPHADAGLTGRKIIADSYGGAAHHGGGAFSGKDPTKVDRSAAYMARKIAKNVVAAQLATRCELQISYAIGIPQPTSIALETFGTEKVEVAAIVKAIEELFDLSPAGIIKELDLRRPIYRPTAYFGHFGRPQFPWEKCDKVEALQRAIR